MRDGESPLTAGTVGGPGVIRAVRLLFMRQITFTKSGRTGAVRRAVLLHRAAGAPQRATAAARPPPDVCARGARTEGWGARKPQR
eukprot:3312265-Prymnesium_polylepis.1